MVASEGESRTEKGRVNWTTVLWAAAAGILVCAGALESWFLVIPAVISADIGYCFYLRNLPRKTAK